MNAGNLFNPKKTGGHMFVDALGDEKEVEEVGEEPLRGHDYMHAPRVICAL
jgi:hypothetical protein